MASLRTGLCGLAALAALALVVGAGCRPTAGALPGLEAEIGQTSVSGVSAGAYMAGQFHLAHSRLVIGAAIIAGGPYGCAESLFADQMPGPGTAFLNLSKAMNGCMRDGLQAWGVPKPRLLAERAERLAADRRIDPLAGVRRGRVYLFSGSEDRTVVPAIVAAAVEFYRLIGVPAEQIKLVTEIAAGHGFVTRGKGVACARTAAPYIVDCGYDQAGELLRHAYGDLSARATRLAGQFVEFDQREFTRDLVEHGLEDVGVVYVPPECRQSAGCRVHIAFHGCAQNRAAVDDAFLRDTGLAEWAETNRLLVLFPQAAQSAMNPQACWDWWGYTGRDFLTQQAPQVMAIHRMLERLGRRRVAG